MNATVKLNKGNKFVMMVMVVVMMMVEVVVYI